MRADSLAMSVSSFPNMRSLTYLVFVKSPSAMPLYATLEIQAITCRLVHMTFLKSTYICIIICKCQIVSPVHKIVLDGGVLPAQDLVVLFDVDEGRTGGADSATRACGSIRAGEGDRAEVDKREPVRSSKSSTIHSALASPRAADEERDLDTVFLVVLF